MYNSQQQDDSRLSNITPMTYAKKLLSDSPSHYMVQSSSQKGTLNDVIYQREEKVSAPYYHVFSD